MIDNERVDAVMLEVMVAATVDGHNLGAWVLMENDARQARGWQAICGLCGRSVWVGVQGVVYSILGEEGCRGRG